MRSTFSSDDGDGACQCYRIYIVVVDGICNVEGIDIVDGIDLNGTGELVVTAFDVLCLLYQKKLIWVNIRNNINAYYWTRNIIVVDPKTTRKIVKYSSKNCNEKTKIE